MKIIFVIVKMILLKSQVRNQSIQGNIGNIEAEFHAFVTNVPNNFPSVGTLYSFY